MHQLGLKHCADLQALTRTELANHFGSFGERLYKLCRGEDERPVQSNRRRKSVSVEHTFAQNLETQEKWLSTLPKLLDSLKQRWQKLDHSYQVQGLFCKVRYHDFSTSTCEAPAPYLDEEVLENLLSSLWKRRQEPARLLGIGIRLKDYGKSHQLDLFPEAHARSFNPTTN